jgi:hypothetical protein
MSDGTAALQSMIAELEALGRDGLAEVAREAESLVLAEAQRTAAAGTDPDGKPWPARKEDGGRALKNAAAHITVQAAGPTLRIKLTGPDVYHHYGARGVRRQVIPDGAVAPAGIVRALRQAADRVAARRLGAA